MTDLRYRTALSARTVVSAGQVRYLTRPPSLDQMERISTAAPKPSAAIRAVVFSKDRPMQLDACLASIAVNAPYSDVVVIFRATTAGFAAGYRQAASEHDVCFHEQTDFREDVLSALRSEVDHVVFHTDDEVIFRRVPPLAQLPEGVACLSLRLGENTRWCYPLDRAQAVPKALRFGELMLWDWGAADADFSYPMSLNGHVFRMSTMRMLVSESGFRNPNELEAQLHVRRHRVPRLAMSFSESRAVCLPVNVVSDTHSNRACAQGDLDPGALNARYLAGERIALDKLRFDRVTAAHTELELSFRTS